MNFWLVYLGVILGDITFALILGGFLIVDWLYLRKAGI